MPTKHLDRHFILPTKVGNAYQNKYLSDQANSAYVTMSASFLARNEQASPIKRVHVCPRLSAGICCSFQTSIPTYAEEQYPPEGIPRLQHSDASQPSINVGGLIHAIPSPFGRSPKIHFERSGIYLGLLSLLQCQSIQLIPYSPMSSCYSPALGVSSLQTSIETGY